MRILTWNINGVRTLPQYHPWNTLKSHDEILSHLEADIICFQEVKSSRASLPKSVALPPSYDAFFSFPTRKSGYSGVATYTRTNVIVPLKAEEGITGLLQPKPPLTPDERISHSGIYPANDENDDVDYQALDSEGRAIVVDFGFLVLINTYCPNEGAGTEERDKFKMDYHRTLEARVQGLIREGREVIVVGDINSCAAVIDHCEGPLLIERGQSQGFEGDSAFYELEYRRWLRDWLKEEDGTGGCMIDVTRRFWPGRKGMYTCWNTKISARESNYGTRIDYILITSGLLPWIKNSDIQPHIKGSDHCPVFVEFHEEITDASGTVLKLKDLLGGMDDPPRDPPRLATKYWEEYSGKQMLLDKFFGKKCNESLPLSTPPEVPPLVIEPISTVSSVTMTEPAPMEPPDIEITKFSLPVAAREPSFSNSNKRKLTTDSSGPSFTSKKPKQKKEPEQKSGQPKLSSFFVKPPKTPRSTPLIITNGKGKEKVTEPPSDIDIEGSADYQIMLLNSQESTSSQGSSGKSESKQAWSDLLAPIKVPKCTIHGELAKEYTVNKHGPNKGKRFFLCSRPVGPGYDKGPSERLREQVDHQYKCNFFKWSSDVRKEMSKK